MAKKIKTESVTLSDVETEIENGPPKADVPFPAGAKVYWLELDIHTSQATSDEPDIAARRGQIVLKITAKSRVDASRRLEVLLQSLIDLGTLASVPRAEASELPVQVTPQYENRSLIVPCTVCGAATGVSCDMTGCKVDGAVVHNARYIEAAKREKELANGVQPTVEVKPSEPAPEPMGLDF